MRTLRASGAPEKSAHQVRGLVRSCQQLLHLLRRGCEGRQGHGYRQHSILNDGGLEACDFECIARRLVCCCGGARAARTFMSAAAGGGRSGDKGERHERSQHIGPLDCCGVARPAPGKELSVCMQSWCAHMERYHPNTQTLTADRLCDASANNIYQM